MMQSLAELHLVRNHSHTHHYSDLLTFQIAATFSCPKGSPKGENMLH